MKKYLKRLLVVLLVCTPQPKPKKVVDDTDEDEDDDIEVIEPTGRGRGRGRGRGKEWGTMIAPELLAQIQGILNIEPLTTRITRSQSTKN